MTRFYAAAFLLLFVIILLTITCKEKENELLPAEIALMNSDGLMIGAATEDITPGNPVNVDLEGYGNDRKSTGVHDSLTARCIIINDGKTIVALISLDLIGMYLKHADNLKNSIVQHTGIKAENIFISCSHTHSGPAMLGDDRLNETYRKKLNSTVTKCLLEAFKKSKKTKASISKGFSNVNTINRRYPEKVILNKFTSIEFKDSSQNTLATMINFGCHPVTLGTDNLLITADYIYYLRKKVESEKGGMAIFFNSRFGDINPPPVNMQFIYERIGGTFEMARVMGEKLAQDVIEAGSKSEPLEISLSTATKKISSNSNEAKINTHISILNFGAAQIAMVPGEPLEGFTEKIEEILSVSYPMVFGQTDDAIGYIIPENEWDACTTPIIACQEEARCIDKKVAGLLIGGFFELKNK